MISREYLDRAMTYEEYRKLLQDLFAQGKTTGSRQDASYLNYAKLNLQRMSRLDKTVDLNTELKDALNKINTSYVWLVLTEGWCSDAAQNLPILAAIEKNCLHIALKLLLRDENLDLMDQYLTGQGRSIPKLICVEQETNAEVFSWGPRPAEAQQLMIDLRKNNTPSAEKSILIQKWYNADKTMTLQREFLSLVQAKLK